MKAARRWVRLVILLAWTGGAGILSAGTWSDHFSQNFLGADWQGDRDYFSIVGGALKGVSALPLPPSPFNRVEVGKDWSDYSIQCRINVVEPNLLVCTKGALVLRDNGAEGYVFALHVATKTVEVYRLSDHQMLLTRDTPLELKKWYLAEVRLHGATMDFFLDGEFVGTVTDDRSLSGRVGIAVQDVLDARFDDFTVTGPGIPGNGLELSAGPNITIKWPVTLTNYVLKTAPLLSAAAWETVTNTPSTNGDQFTLSVSPTSGSRFYMLVPQESGK